ncbi:ISL3 family transposase [Lactiplantibacillus plantarum]|nr:ISL3 family transposase [Lactiplantibacillus plantarum]MCG0644327.1 ISL3 family transposase [Lactiplantibacillus plantarum]MCG0653610.1 ISL3 family transposase [Lactiplantibacillus plantarum]MCG0684905.1 ISL3 family transposase [Lactiplantibacillus plantarum]MCG0786547.1 ISL3 family transposase [Lactiplantibacillus plantarum]
MNGSPLYTLLLRQNGVRGVYSIGRVQTPTLYMVYQRDQAIKNFKPEPYFELNAEILANQQKFVAKLDPYQRFKDETGLMTFMRAKHVHKGSQDGLIKDVQKQGKKRASPQLFSLSSLQSAMNKRYHASASQTLAAIQSLYEAKLLSYPRTDCAYITDEEFDYLVANLTKYLGLVSKPVALTNTTQAFVHELFPNAELIIDRFHIIQLIGRTMDTIRTQCLKQLDKHSREYKVLKSLWRLFHKANPDAQKSRYLFGLNEYSTEQNAIDIGTNTFPAFKTAYETYIDLHDALMGCHADELKNIITNYQPNGTPLDTAMHTLRKNLNGVINAAKSSYSNGPIEGINRKIKELKRACYGFSNQANMFTRVYQLIA